MLSSTLATDFLSCLGCRNAENAESPLHIILLHDRDILAWNEGVIAEPVAGFIIVFIAVNVIVECPTPAGLSDQVAYLIILILPETTHPAFVAKGGPLRRIDLAVRIEGGSEKSPFLPRTLRRPAEGA